MHFFEMLHSADTTLFILLLFTRISLSVPLHYDIRCSFRRIRSTLHIRLFSDHESSHGLKTKQLQLK